MPLLTLDPQVVEREAVQAEIAAIARYLQDTLGQKITAYLSGLTDAKVVGKWARGEAKPKGFAETRLRHAYQVAKLIVDAYDANTARAWLFGCNTRLGDRAPAMVLRNADSPDGLASVVPTARAFAAME